MVLVPIAKTLCFILSVHLVAAGSVSGPAITTTCYKKNNLGTPKSNQGVNGAKILLVHTPDSTWSSATSTATSDLLSSDRLSSSSTSSSTYASSGTSSLSSQSQGSKQSSAVSTPASSSLDTQERTTATTSKLVTPSPIVGCPSANGTEYTTPMGDIFVIECYLDRKGSDMKMVQVGSLKLSDCIDACSATPGCVDISMSGSACYMKKASRTPISNQAIRGARMVYSANNSTTLPVAGSSSPGSSSFSTPDYPSANGTSYTAANGAMFIIECGMDRAGNDLSIVHINSGQLQACMDICSSTSKCVDVSMSGSACYMKHDIGAHIVHNGVSGARLVQTSRSSSTSLPVTDI